MHEGLKLNIHLWSRVLMLIMFYIVSASSYSFPVKYCVYNETYPNFSLKVTVATATPINPYQMTNPRDEGTLMPAYKKELCIGSDYPYSPVKVDFFIRAASFIFKDDWWGNYIDEPPFGEYGSSPQPITNTKGDFHPIFCKGYIDNPVPDKIYKIVAWIKIQDGNVVCDIHNEDANK